MAAFTGGYYIGNENFERHQSVETNRLKDRVIEYLGDQNILLENSNLVFETIDRRVNSIAVTGMIRTTEPDRERVGRFWIEFSMRDGKWTPTIVQAKTKSDDSSGQITWP